jgi:hypothetical protein
VSVGRRYRSRISRPAPGALRGRAAYAGWPRTRRANLPDATDGTFGYPDAGLRVLLQRADYLFEATKSRPRLVSRLFMWFQTFLNGLSPGSTQRRAISRWRSRVCSVIRAKGVAFVP